MVIVMEFLPNGYTLDTSGGVFPLSTDSMLLADFAHLPRNARVLDLGAGCGTLGVLLCAGHPACRVTGVEMDEVAHEAALQNIQRNGLNDRMESICADLRTVSLELGSFQVCISNPPYFSGGPASKSNPLARREDCCAPDALFAAATKFVKYGGDFFLVHKPERLAELIACGAKEQMEAKRLRLVRHTEGGEISLILLQFRKGGKPGLKIDEVFLFHQDQTPSEYYQTVYHLK